MPMPTDVPIIDLMLAVPNDDTSNFYDFIRPLLMDEQSRQMFQMPAQYMFKDLPKVGKRDDYIAYTLEKMDEFNIEKAMLGVDEGQYETQNQAVKQHPDRFFASYDCNPNNGMEEVRKIRRLKEEYDIKSVNAFPSGLCPQVSLADKKWYPIFVTCIDLDIPFCPCVGVLLAPESQWSRKDQVEHLDEICWFFPVELKVVMKHGGDHNALDRPRLETHVEIREVSTT